MVRNQEQCLKVSFLPFRIHLLLAPRFSEVVFLDDLDEETVSTLFLSEAVKTAAIILVD
jgi:hypothetical protein